MILVPSHSPAYTIRNSVITKHTYINKCFFSKFFSQGIYSKTNNHQTIIQNTKFSYIQQNAIKFSSERCHNYFGVDYQYKKDKPFKHLERNSTDFGECSDCRIHIICESGEPQGHLFLYTCIIDHCYSRDGRGGGVCYEQDGIFFMHETILSYCYTRNYGGGILAVKKFSSYPDSDGYQTFNDEQIYEFTSQYCCYQNCLGISQEYRNEWSYGLSIYTSAYISVILYSSCVIDDFSFRPENYKKDPFGGIIDVQSTNSTTHAVNLTNGMSVYCGGIENRNIEIGKFEYQTFKNITGAFIASFSDYKQVANVNYCNFVSCKATSYSTDFAAAPSLILVSGNSLFVSNTYFLNNNLKYKGATVVASGNMGNGTVLTLSKCYFDSTSVKNNIQSYVKTQSCSWSSQKTYNQPYLSLGGCKGKATPAVLIISSFFTASAAFTKSDFFPSNPFTKSSEFTQSSVFTASKEFTASKPFTPSNKFTPTRPFTKTQEFTKTGEFSKTTEFTISSIFTASKEFTASKPFTPSNKFTPTRPFTKTQEFTKTCEFSKTTEFTISSIFTASKEFTASKPFTPSNKFTPTRPFTKTQEFTKTGEFSKTTEFTISSIFTESKDFTQSKKFTASRGFKPTKAFTGTQGFTKTGEFSKTTEFTISSIFTDSKPFTQSGAFTDSRRFKPTEAFTQSKYFTKSSEFTRSIAFTCSNEFSESDDFTASGSFTPSKSAYFTQSSAFTNSLGFTESSEFSASSYFTASRKFVRYNPSLHTIHMSMTVSYTTGKSVSFSFSVTISESASYVQNEDGSFSLTVVGVNVSRNFPYVIFIIETTYVPTQYMIDLNVAEKGLTSEQLVGIVCGSACAFFVVLSAAIFVYRKMTGGPEYLNEDSFFSDSMDTDSGKQKETEKEFEIQRTDQIIEDSWL